MWAARGVRYVGVTHFGHNQFGDSSNPNAELGDAASRHDGLSPLGEELIAALNRAGIMVDVSHAGKATMMDAVALSRAPIIASHSGVKAIYDNARNLDDEQLRAIAQNNGVAQMVAYAGYVKQVPAERTAAINALLERLGLTRDTAATTTGETLAAYEAGMAEIEAQWPRATVSDFADHIDHAVTVAGIDHVGIASDFDGGGGVTGWADATETAAVTAELLRRGYSEQDLAKIWGGNLLRVLDDVEAAGRSLRREE
jgi:membrane dipeptidase